MGEDFTDENVQRIARAFVVYLCQNSAQIPSTVAIGYDGRKNSRLYADLIADTLSQSGIDVLLSNEITPTPALSFATKFKNCSAGIMITASQNPQEYNGIKFKGSYGGPLMTEATKKIESLLDSRPQRFSGRQGVVQELNFLPEYR